MEFRVLPEAAHPAPTANSLREFEKMLSFVGAVKKVAEVPFAHIILHKFSFDAGVIHRVLGYPDL